MKKNKNRDFFEKLKSNRELDEITKRTNFGINKDQIFFSTKSKIEIQMPVQQESKNHHY